MQYIIYDNESGIICFLSEEIEEIPETVYFLDKSNNINFSHNEYSYKAMDKIPLHVYPYNYKYNKDKDIIERIMSPQEIINERKAMLHTMHYKVDALEKNIGLTEEAMDALCDLSITMEEVENALCDLSKEIEGE